MKSEGGRDQNWLCGEMDWCGYLGDVRNLCHFLMDLKEDLVEK